MLELSTLFSIFIVGLSYGSTACMFSCMPFLTPLLMSNANSTKEALGVIIPFSLGRVFSYTLLAVIAYLSSFWVKKILNDTDITSTILGLVTIGMGCFIFYGSFKKSSTCRVKKTTIKDKKRFGFFTMGAAMAINPCAPILTLVGVAINSTAVLSAFLHGIFFGLGAVLFSILFYGLIFSKLIRGLMMQFSSCKLWIDRAMALFLMILGAQVMLGNITL